MATRPYVQHYGTYENRTEAVVNIQMFGRCTPASAVELCPGQEPIGVEMTLYMWSAWKHFPAVKCQLPHSNSRYDCALFALTFNFSTCNRTQVTPDTDANHSCHPIRCRLVQLTSSCLATKPHPTFQLSRTTLRQRTSDQSLPHRHSLPQEQPRDQRGSSHTPHTHVSCLIPELRIRRHYDRKGSHVDQP